jgi:hypothetical protein
MIGVNFYRHISVRGGGGLLIRKSRKIKRETKMQFFCTYYFDPIIPPRAT